MSRGPGSCPRRYRLYAPADPYTGPSYCGLPAGDPDCSLLAPAGEVPGVRLAPLAPDDFPVVTVRDPP